MPVKSRGPASHPNQDDVWGVLQPQLKNVPVGYATYLVGDFNAEAARNIKGVTGKWAVRRRSNMSMDAAGIRLVENLRELKMSMLCTQAQAKPKKRGGVASFGVHADPSLRHKLETGGGGRRPPPLFIVCCSCAAGTSCCERSDGLWPRICSVFWAWTDPHPPRRPRALLGRLFCGGFGRRDLGAGAPIRSDYRPGAAATAVFDVSCIIIL
jgi:hypothetical protein